MRRFADEAKIARSARAGKFLLYGGLAMMAASMIAVVTRPDLSTVAVFPAFAGLLAVQFGSVYSNRWSRHPRLDELVDEAFKGLDGRYVVIHYKLGTPHALISPSGLFAVVPRLEDGLIQYGENAWTQTTERRSRFRSGGTRAIRNLNGQASAEADVMASSLKKNLPEGSELPVTPILLFLHPKAQLRAPASPLPAFHAKKAKEGIRRLPKAASLSDEQLGRLVDRLRLT
jgi:hypothetical protein